TIKTDLLLVGSTREIVYDPVAIDKKINENKFLQKDLADFNISDASGLLSCFLLADNELAELSKDGFVNSDNFPFLEYFAPLNLYGFEKTVFRNWEMLVSYRQARYPKMTKAPRGGREKIDFHNAIARGFIQKGSYQDAEIEIGLANREEAFNKGALLNYGIFSAFFGKADEAIANLESYLKQDPLNAEANFYIAKVYDFKQNFDQALPHYQTAAQQEPKNDEYLFSYAQSLMRSPDKQKAIGVLQKVVELAGLNIENGFALSEAFVANQQFEPAIKTLRLLSKEYPSFYGVYEEMARFYDDAHQYAQGLLVCREAQARFPFNARNYYLMSNFYEKLGNAHEARKMARIYSYYQNAPKIGISE
ncbi:MAG: tetratricopeptide repeat protein, partial [Candidatus Omnitrophica bacterium]|nr:tetratricopeptide repeat protein [Candidatus Omnitrophota bacterium]